MNRRFSFALISIFRLFCFSNSIFFVYFSKRKYFIFSTPCRSSYGKFVLTLFLSLPYYLYSQTETVFDKMRMVPTGSPQAAAFAKYTDFPVSYYTGIPEISIPLYTIQTGDLVLPISLSYHSGGIRVAEEASWVGLGWNLQAGGMIMRQVRGKDDHKLSTYFFDEVFPGGTNGRKFNAYHKNEAKHGVCTAYDSVGNSISSAYPNPNTELESLVLNGDGEPDVYIYNFGNYSGKFIDVGNKVYDLNRNNIRFIVSITKITAITPDGNVYEFNDLERNWVGTNPQAITGYYLSKITSSKGKEITFLYEYLNNKLQLPSYSEEFTAFQPVQVGSGSSGSTGLYNRSFSSLNANYVILDKITFSEGYIDFIPGTREDMDSKKLNQLEVRYNAGGLFKRITFNHSYFIGASTNHYLTTGGPVYPLDYLRKRLKLTGISEVGSNISDKPLTHSFEYYEGGNYTLPYKSSYAADFFGFYNGKQINTTFIPSTHSLVIATDMEKIKNYAGANRNPDESFIKAGTLKKITYPTKGWTEYEHSIHKFTNSEIAPQKYRTNTFEVIDYSTGIKERIFSHPGGEMQIDVSLYCDCAVNSCICANNNPNPSWTCGSVKDNGYNINTLYAELRKLNTTTGNYDFINWDLNWELYDILPCSLNGNGMFQKKVTLPAGTYKMVVNYPDNKVGEVGHKMAFMMVTYTELYYDENPVGGGLRVSKIKNYDPEKLTYLSRTFEYSNGLLMFFPKFYWRSLEVKLETPQGRMPEFIGYLYEYLYSNPVIPSSPSANGSSVGYGKVIEIIEGGELGKIEYSFENTVDNINHGSIPNVPAVAFFDSHAPGIPSTPHLTNGFLKEKTIYDNLNLPIKKTISTPSIVIPQTVWAFKGQRTNVGSESFSIDICNPQNTVGTYFMYYFYPIQIGKVLPSKIVEKEYLNGSETLSTTRDLEYNLQAFLKSEKITGSDGKSYTTENKYIQDYTKGTSGWIYDMYEKNITSTPIEVLNKVNTSTTGGSFVKFKTTGSHIGPNEIYDIEVTSPKTVASTAPSGSLPTNSDFKLNGLIEYNTNGNISYTRSANNITTSYLWGYNNSKPIAIVQNALPTEVYYNNFEESTANFTATSKTGTKAYNGATAFTVPVPSTTGTFKLTYWKKVGTGAWQYMEEEMSGANKAIGGTGAIIDDIRVYPLNANMTTYTYDLLSGVTSITDANGRTAYYTYDSFGRLRLIKDENGKIINQYLYHYIE